MTLNKMRNLFILPFIGGLLLSLTACPEDEEDSFYIKVKNNTSDSLRISFANDFEDEHYEDWYDHSGSAWGHRHHKDTIWYVVEPETTVALDTIYHWVPEKKDRNKSLQHRVLEQFANLNGKNLLITDLDGDTLANWKNNDEQMDVKHWRIDAQRDGSAACTLLLTKEMLERGR